MASKLIYIDEKAFSSEHQVQLDFEEPSPIMEGGEVVGIIRKDTEPTSPTVEQKVADNLKNFYFVSEGKLMCKILSRGNRIKEQTVMTLEHYNQKVVTVPQAKGPERIFLIGGSSDKRGGNPIGDVYEVHTGGKKKPHLSDLSPILTPRIGIAACVSIDGQQIFTVGGASGENKKSTNECEVYDIQEDTWTPLCQINQP